MLEWRACEDSHVRLVAVTQLVANGAPAQARRNPTPKAEPQRAAPRDHQTKDNDPRARGCPHFAGSSPWRGLGPRTSISASAPRPLLSRHFFGGALRMD